MVCPNCQQTTSRLRVYEDGYKACAACLGLSESAGAKVDGTLTRNSTRIRDQQRTHEADIMMPHVFDRNTRDLVPNPDFIQHHADKIATTYNQGELEKAGHKRIGEVFKQHKEIKKAHARQQSQGVTYRGPTNRPLAPPV